MAKNLLFAVFLWCTSFSYAQTIKTDVLVIGGTPSGVAAAIQSARSKLKTLLIMPKQEIDIEIHMSRPLPADIVAGLAKIPHRDTYIIPTNQNLPSGIWGEFRDRVRAFYKSTPGYDTTYNAPLKFEKYTGLAVLKGIADTVKNLTVKLNTTFTAIKKDGTGWEVSITVNGKTDIIKTKVVVDATYEGEVISKVGAAVLPAYNVYKNYNETLQRTSIAVADYGDRSDNPHVDFTSPIGYSIPMKYAIANDVENLLVTEKALPEPHGGLYLPAQLTVGQGVGCIAAYCAFFKTTTKNLNTRIIQQELLDFKGYLMPYEDIKPDNKYIRAVQQVGATGMLKRIYKGFDMVFMPDTTVTATEIKPVLNEIYSRAFIWFDKEKPGELFSVGNTLSLISEFTLTEPKTLQATLQKEWQVKYGFTNFNTARPITRLEFAVLVNQYLNPFAHKIDLDGNIVN